MNGVLKLKGEWEAGRGGGNIVFTRHSDFGGDTPIKLINEAD